MRVGIDATCWANERGYGRFARELSHELFLRAPDVQWLCFGDHRAFERYAPEGANISLIAVETRESPTVAAAADGSRSPFDMLRLTRAVWQSKPDVFFSPTVYTYFPLPFGQRCVITIHDAIAERFPHLTLPSARARLFWKLKVKAALAQADLVLTVSDFAARDLQRVLGVSPRRMRVAVEAPAPEFTPASIEEKAQLAQSRGLPVDARWFTYVGGFNPHKRVDLIIRAHAQLARELSPAPFLLLVGKTSGDVFHGELGKLKALVAECGTEHLVQWTGYQQDPALRVMHSGAIATLLPSECEGFGLPAVEAAACGTPVVATTESPLPELLPEAGVFVGPGDLDALTAAMRRLATDAAFHASSSSAARRSAARLTWSSAADVTLQALREVAR